ELFKDVTFGLAPISRQGAQRMLHHVKAFKLLEGLRGSPPADVDNIRECIQRLGQLAADFPRICELDINPLIVGPRERGNSVADVRIRLSEP
ncbi:MAG TPA: acetate--CoA ligase family protein, partial [Thermoguttaceae bacterium]|nr:acetate--CoA ligase family protein [Thermoguttaceae bacterium]